MEMNQPTVRKNRCTGSEIEVCTAESEDLDPEPGKWVTICWTHGWCIHHATKAIATAWATTPDAWCEDAVGEDGSGATLNSCRGVWEAKQEG